MMGPSRPAPPPGGNAPAGEHPPGGPPPRAGSAPCKPLPGLPDAVSGDAFEAAKARAAGDRRVQSAERLRAAVVKALREIHAALNPEQRTRFAYLIRTGAL